jgi:TolA-binding protein
MNVIEYLQSLRGSYPTPDIPQPQVPQQGIPLQSSTNPSPPPTDQQPQLSPDNVFYRQGLVALNNSDYAAAAEAFKKTLAINPDHPEAKRGLERLTQIMALTTRLGRSTSNGYR